MQIGPCLNCRQNKRSFSARCRTDVALFLPLLPSSPSSSSPPLSSPPPPSPPPSSSSPPSSSLSPQSLPASPSWSRITTCKHGLTQSPADSKVRLLLGKSLMMTMLNTKHHLDLAFSNFWVKSTTLTKVYTSIDDIHIKLKKALCKTGNRKAKLRSIAGLGLIPKFYHFFDGFPYVTCSGANNSGSTE